MNDDSICVKKSLAIVLYSELYPLEVKVLAGNKKKNLIVKATDAYTTNSSLYRYHLNSVQCGNKIKKLSVCTTHFPNKIKCSSVIDL